MPVGDNSVKLSWNSEEYPWLTLWLGLVTTFCVRNLNLLQPKRMEYLDVFRPRKQLLLSNRITTISFANPLREFGEIV